MSSDNTKKKKFKILALDGGGIRGLVTANILKEVEKQIQATLGKPVPLNEYFDLIAGTSTGSILAAGLVLGMKPDELCGIYEKRGGEIFQTNPIQELFSWLYGSKYSHDGLIKVLREKFKEIKFGEVGKYEFTELGEIQLRDATKKPPAELLIFAYDTLYRNTTFFVSPPHEQNRWFNQMKLWEVCLSSASAPTYFPPYEFKFTDPVDQKRKVFPHVDGGVSTNCPALAALSHVLKTKKKNLEDIAVLSIGTGRNTQPLEQSAIEHWGKLSWASHITDVFMGGQIQIATDGCDHIIKSVNPNGYLRLQFELNKRLQNGRLLPADEQVNEYIDQEIDEAMDNTSKENIKKLKDATQKFIEKKKQDITKFIESTESIELVKL